MKKFTWTVFCLIIGALLVSCQHRSDLPPVERNTSADAASDTSASQPAPEVTQEEKKMNETQPALRWRFYSQEQKHPEIQALFDQASQLIQQKTGKQRDFDTSSEHYGSWLIMRYPSPEPNPNVLDKDPDAADAFLVDMEQKKIIAKGAWNDAKPLYDLMLREAKNNPDRIEKWTKYMVYMTSIIAFGNEKYMNSGERGTDGPQLLEQADGSYILNYDVAPRESSVIGTHCTLSLQPAAIEFRTEEKTME